MPIARSFPIDSASLMPPRPAGVRFLLITSSERLLTLGRAFGDDSKQSTAVITGKMGLGRPVRISLVRRCNGILIIKCPANQRTPSNSSGQSSVRNSPNLPLVGCPSYLESKELRSRREQGTSHCLLLWFSGSELEA